MIFWGVYPKLPLCDTAVTHRGQQGWITSGLLRLQTAKVCLSVSTAGRAAAAAGIQLVEQTPFFMISSDFMSAL